MRPWRTDRTALRLAVALLIGLVVAAPPARGDPRPAIETGFSADGLKGVSDYFENEVSSDRIPGAVVLIQQHGEPVYFKTFGQRDAAAHAPMTKDAIFRLYSMSKPITAVAAMMLVDDGKIALHDPLSKYIPSFADVKVGVEQKDASGKAELTLEPLQRPITIEDLLRHTSGITYGFYGDGVVRRLYRSSGLFDGDFDNAQFAARLAKLPLAEQPEAQWDYGHSSDVLGRVIEVVSERPLFQFEKQRLLDPLGMKDTGFFVPEAKRGRVAAFRPNGGFKRPIAGLDDPIQQRRWESGGAGMDGTARDYARFAEMLLEGGALDGRRYLKPQTVALMTSDRIGPETGIRRDGFYFPHRDSGFGLGFAVRTVATRLLPAGEYGWDGVGGTFFFIDPRDDMFAIVMMQSPSQRGRIQTEVKKLIYEALRK
ncbi:MAG TPA: serine hydrolase domain-containing protein [Bradyrhizobium sp.]|uniref:serine hydrolase domain-containing protein n=1 Tax=Bradyrhizobium sp. TaxID=376 RepID=UPI002D1B8BC7|nr:serine hydrolase domain-containing protein [Bradyrhizobium sp.]HLZ06489.1 serine hydrolase domain-containing protein [Bradyrhizobium sp.]